MGAEYDVHASIELTPAELKAKGNALVKEGKYEDARSAFSVAIDRAPDELHLYFSNRSLCNLHLGDAESAEADARRAIEQKPAWAKGHARLGNALAAAGRHAEAVKAFAAGLAHDPTSAALIDGIKLSSSTPEGTPLGPAAAATPPQPQQQQQQQQQPTTVPEPAAGGGDGDDVVVGIDLGTTYSAVSVVRPGAGRVEMIPNSNGAHTTASWVAFAKEDGTRLVGDAAKNQAASNPGNTVNDAKRLIGRAFSESAVQADAKHLSCRVEEGPSGKPMIAVEVCGEKRSFAPEQISAMVLEQLKADAEAFLGQAVKRAVITVPAHFNDAQRQATKDAGTIAGLDVLRIINEPTAAAIAYGLDKARGGKAERNVLIFDLGGGTFDVSVLAMEGGIFEVKATGGDTRLGGEDFDAATTKWLEQQFLKSHPGVAIDARGRRRLIAAAERAKRHLSSQTTAEVEIEAFSDGHDLKVPLSRAKFESINAAFFSSCIDTVKKVLKDSGLAKEEIDEVVLVGGSTRVPKIRSLLSDYFGGKQLCSSINPDEAVAYGAAVQAGVLSGGLAAAGGALAKASTGLVLMDVVPLSLGIETTGKVMATIVKRNTPIPCRRVDTFTTEEDGQTAIDVAIFEGERASTDACSKLGEFTITGIERAKRGEPQIEVSMDIDANGILSVSAKDKTTGAKASTTIAATASRNSNEDVARMVEEARVNAAADKVLREKAEAKRLLEDAIFDVQDDDDASPTAKADAEEAEAWLSSDFDAATAAQIRDKANRLRRRR